MAAAGTCVSGAGAGTEGNAEAGAGTEGAGTGAEAGVASRP